MYVRCRSHFTKLARRQHPQRTSGCNYAKVANTSPEKGAKTEELGTAAPDQSGCFPEPLAYLLELLASTANSQLKWTSRRLCTPLPRNSSEHAVFVVGLQTGMKESCLGMAVKAVYLPGATIRRVN